MDLNTSLPASPAPNINTFFRFIFVACDSMISPNNLKESLEPKINKHIINSLKNISNDTTQYASAAVDTCHHWHWHCCCAQRSA